MRSNPESRALRTLRLSFERAERARLDALDLYYATVRFYHQRRSPRTRADAYLDVQDAYARAHSAWEWRNRFAEDYERELAEVQGLLPVGTEFELTATTRGGSPRGDRRIMDPRVLHLKIRVVLDRAMSAETARALLDRAVQEHRVPSGITVHTIDWAKGASGEQQSDDPVSTQLRRFYGAITQGQTRFARVIP